MVYALALEQTDSNGKPQWTTFDTLPNERRTFRNTNGWTPRNNGGKYSETTTLSRAVAISQNVATASLLEQLGGPLPLIDFADRLGFDTIDFPEELGLALGQAEVTPLKWHECQPSLQMVDSGSVDSRYKLPLTSQERTMSKKMPGVSG